MPTSSPSRTSSADAQLSLRADPRDPSAGAGRHGVEIGVLGTLVLALSPAAYLLRRKEREPQEAAKSGQGADEEDS